MFTIMEVFGPHDRVLDSVIPHEVLHTVFASYFGCPLPKWADEGSCTTVEHASERRKQDHLLISFLNHVPSRGIAFNRMFMMTEYPADMMPAPDARVDPRWPVVWDDELGLYAVEDKMHVHDIHATILHILGLDFENLTYRFNGRDMRLTDVHGGVIDEILGKER